MLSLERNTGMLCRRWQSCGWNQTGCWLAPGEAWPEARSDKSWKGGCVDGAWNTGSAAASTVRLISSTDLRRSLCARTDRRKLPELEEEVKCHTPGRSITAAPTRSKQNEGRVCIHGAGCMEAA